VEAGEDLHEECHTARKSGTLFPESRASKLLIVDDDDLVRMSLQLLLQARGYDVVTAAGGAEALHVLKRKPVDLVLTQKSRPQAPFFRCGDKGAAGHRPASLLAIVRFLLYNGVMQTNVPFMSNRNVVYSCKYHVVWCPKYRRPVLVEGVDTRLRDILSRTAAELETEIFEMEVMPDHVHLLCEVDPQFGMHRLVKRLKGRSSRLLREEFPRLKSRLPTLWTNSYFVATVGGAPLVVIKQYIE
jgi:putative transposase